MSETTNAPEVDAVLEELDIMSWLGEAANATGEIELYRDGPLLVELQELTDMVDDLRDARKRQAAQLLAPDVQSIADEGSSAIDNAVARIEEIREALKGSGTTWHLEGISPGDRDAAANKLAKDSRFRAKKASEDEPAVPGGSDHPDYADAWRDLLMSKSIKKVVAPNGAVSTKHFSPEECGRLRFQLPGAEFSRLSSKIARLNYISYDIERLVDVDFS